MDAIYNMCIANRSAMQQVAIGLDDMCKDALLDMQGATTPEEHHASLEYYTTLKMQYWDIQQTLAQIAENDAA